MIFLVFNFVDSFSIQDFDNLFSLLLLVMLFSAFFIFPFLRLATLSDSLFAYKIFSSFIYLQFFHHFFLQFCFLVYAYIFVSFFSHMILFHHFFLHGLVSSLPVPSYGYSYFPQGLILVQGRCIMSFNTYALEWLATTKGCATYGLVRYIT